MPPPGARQIRQRHRRPVESHPLPTPRLGFVVAVAAQPVRASRVTFCRLANHRATTEVLTVLPRLLRAAVWRRRHRRRRQRQEVEGG